MDQEECSTLLDALQGIPDPRKARGQRYPWLLLLALVAGSYLFAPFLTPLLPLIEVTSG